MTEEQLAKRKQTNKKILKWFGIAILAFIIGIFILDGIVECNKSPEQREKEKKEKIVKDSLANIEKELRNIRCYSYDAKIIAKEGDSYDAKIIAKEGDSYDAKIIAKEFVERRLLFPKSVDYGTIEAVWSDKEDGKNWTLIDLTII